MQGYTKLTTPAPEILHSEADFRVTQAVQCVVTQLPASGAPSALLWALECLPEDLWARGVVCPAERAVMLGATSKRVRKLLARLQRRVPATARVVRTDFGKDKGWTFGLFRMQEWCQVVRLDLNKLQRRWGIMMEGAPIDTMDIFGGHIGDDGAGVGMSDDRPIGPIGAGLLKLALTRCSSLVALNLRGNELGDDGVGCLAGDAGSMARVLPWIKNQHGFGQLNLLGQCSSLVALDLGFIGIGADGIGRLAEPSNQFQKSLRICGNAHRSMDGLMSARAAARGSRGLPRLPGAAFRWRQFISAFSCTKTHRSPCPGTFGQNFNQTSVITSSSPWPLSAQCVDLLRRHGER